MKYFKAACYIFLCTFTTVLFYISIKAQQDINNSITTDPTTENKSFVSIPVNEENVSYKGSIKFLLGEGYEYSLNQEDKTVLYLKSTKQDLSLLVGIEVEVIGDIQGNYQGIAIMDVKSIKLK
jgi:hypothetical protein